MARFDTRQIPTKGRVYSDADGEVTAENEGFLYIEADAEFVSIAYDAGANIDPEGRRIGRTYLAGMELHGRIVGFELASGQVLHVTG